MPRKKTISTFIMDDRVEEKMKFAPRKGRIIQSQVMYSSPSMTDAIGVAMTDEIVTILDILYDKNLAYIKTEVTNRMGYIDSKSVV